MFLSRPVFYSLLLVFSAIACTDTSETAAPAVEYYQEQHRPQLHFSPDSMWMNDPNGMVFFDGEYHLFYQYYPDSTVWGPMHWGHAVSTDLMHWEHLPIALYPDSLGYIFSGSAVVDWNNTSGLGKGNSPPLIAIFTHHDPVGADAGDDDFQYQSIAYSIDKGRTWTKYDGNPVIPNPGIRDFRDPKVIWDDDSAQWVMVFAAYDHVKLYGSSNLIDWMHLSDFGREWGTHGGVWECPELFPITVEGTTHKKWVLLSSINPGSPNGGSGTQYFVGHFDGKDFTLDPDFEPSLGKVPAYVPNGDIIADFESGYGAWTSTGEAFGPVPAGGTLPNQNPVTAFTGNYLVNSFYGGDAAKGTLTSPPFEITNEFINFQVAGGNHPEETYIELLINGKTLHTQTGNNSEKLVWTSWDVQDLVGQTAQIRLVDNRSDFWGHINADQFMFSDEAARAETEKAVWLEYGRDNYAGVTWSDIPQEDGRRIFMGWMSNWDYAMLVPTEKWRSAMTLPRVLKLISTSSGLRLEQAFPTELTKIRTEAESMIFSLADGERRPLELDPRQLELQVSLPQADKGQLGIELNNTKGETYTIGFDFDKQAFFSDRTKSGKVDFSAQFAKAIHYAPYQGDGKTIDLQLILDVASAELLADGGLTGMTDVFFPTEDFKKIVLFSQGVDLEEISVQAAILDSVW
ncbi:MAG: glycoside hydrolase family 32 protein [Bacteroidota bacterium]